MPGNASGQALILAVIFLAIIAASSSAILGYVGSVAQAEKRSGENRLAIQIAQAGIEKAIWCLNQSSGTNCGGTFGSNYTGESNVSISPGVFTTTLTTIDTLTKEIESIAFIPNANNPLFSKKIKVRATISSENASFIYGLQVGEDGLTMDNSSTVNGSVYSNGTIDGGNETKITGDAYVAGGTAPTPNQEWTANNNNFIFGQDSPQTDTAQSFIPSVSNAINKFSFFIKKVGSPVNLTVRVVSDNNNEPSKTVFETGTLLASQVTTSYGWVDVALDNPLQVTSGTRYWVILDSSNSASNYWVWALDAPGGYGNGKGMYSSNWNSGNPNWTDTGGDLNFRVFMGGVITKIIDMEIEDDAHANTIEDSEIDGNAYYQTISGTSVGGTSYPGSPDPAPQVFPLSQGQIDQWKNDAAAGGTITGNYAPPKDAVVSLGPKKITGDLILTDGQTLTITGTIYVQGTIDIGTNASIGLSPLYGAYSGIILSDGWIHAQNNGVFTGADSSSYIMLLSTASGGGHHGSAIDLHNNAAGALFFAPNGLIHLHNNVTVNQLTAKKIHLSQNAVLNYQTGLANVNFSSGPGASWKFQPGSWRVVQ